MTDNWLPSWQKARVEKLKKHGAKQVVFRQPGTPKYLRRLIHDWKNIWKEKR